MIRIIFFVILSINLIYSNEFSSKVMKYKQQLREGDISTYFKLGVLYYKSDKTIENINNAFKYFELASKYDNNKAKYNMAMIYSQKLFKDHNYKKAYTIFLNLATQGYIQAQNKVGQFLLYGFDIDKDYTKAKEWFEEAYFIGKYQPAACSLAYMYAEGKGVIVNLGRARKLANEGYIDKDLLINSTQNKLCKKVNKEYKLYKYKKDKGFRFGYY